MRKMIIGLAAAISVAATVPASADGLWIGVPGFGIGIGTGPAYGYGPYYDGYGPYYDGYRGDGYAYEPTVAYSSYAYEPEIEYGAYAYEPAYGDATYSYAPRIRDYDYGRTYSYRRGPSVHYSRSYDERIRTTRGQSYKGVVARDRDTFRHRAPEVRNASLSRESEIRNGRRNTEISSRRVGSEASRAMARSDADDLRAPRLKRLETGKASGDRRNP